MGFYTTLRTGTRVLYLYCTGTVYTILVRTVWGQLSNTVVHAVAIG